MSPISGLPELVPPDQQGTLCEHLRSAQGSLPAPPDNLPDTLAHEQSVLEATAKFNLVRRDVDHDSGALPPASAALDLLKSLLQHQPGLHAGLHRELGALLGVRGIE